MNRRTDGQSDKQTDIQVDKKTRRRTLANFDIRQEERYIVDVINCQ